MVRPVYWILRLCFVVLHSPTTLSSQNSSSHGPAVYTRSHAKSRRIGTQSDFKFSNQLAKAVHGFSGKLAQDDG